MQNLLTENLIKTEKQKKNNNNIDNIITTFYGNLGCLSRKGTGKMNKHIKDLQKENILINRQPEHNTLWKKLREKNNGI